MRRTLFCILIFLTAFRGIVGDAMAYGMTQQALQNLAALESIALQADSMPETGHFSSEKAASMPCHEASDESSTEASSHACTTCQVCHLTASLPSALMQFAHRSPQRDMPQAAVKPWLSAELARDSKPPIL